MPDDKDYILKQPFKYHCSGQELTAKSIKLIGPAPKHRRECQHIKSGFMELAQRQAERPKTDQTKDKEEDELTSKDYYRMFLMAGDAINNYMRSFEKILISGGGIVDGKEPITKNIVENISVEDFENLFGRYLKDFLISSLMN